MASEIEASTVPKEMVETDEAPLKLRIAILHPDLGIGGAERLIVDAALGLQARGHSVEIITSHHDEKHSFDETNDGTLKITHVPSFIPRSIFNGFHIYLAILRQLHLFFVILVSVRWRKYRKPYDVYIVDQLSASVPLVRWLLGRRVVFYCHFPDKLLAAGKEANLDKPQEMSTLKYIYRWPADLIEELSTGYSDVLLANSQFTSTVFKKVFSSIDKNIEIVYPGINIEAYEQALTSEDIADVAPIRSNRPTLISLNRFERKKNTALAIEAYVGLLSSLTPADKSKGHDQIRLVIAGGYDPRLQDNIDTLEHLISICKAHSLSYFIHPNSTPSASLPQSTAKSSSAAQVTFILNFTQGQRRYLLQSSDTVALLYTPANEHFGIVPVEGLISGLPVLAVNSGGPIESLVDYSTHTKEPKTGKNGKSKSQSVQGTAWLRSPSPDAWSAALMEIIRLSKAERDALSIRAKARAKDKFSMKQMCVGFEWALYRATAMGKPDDFPIGWIDLLLMAAGVVAAVWVMSPDKWQWEVVKGPLQFGVLLTFFAISIRIWMRLTTGR
ncbi:Alpha-1,3-mannosyltransferase-like protein [Tulasnella sp. 418]|nr:Alpha-1,3-mannosyltransferase-like protein [Tulasnella sp. 418]